MKNSIQLKEYIAEIKLIKYFNEDNKFLQIKATSNAEARKLVGNALSERYHEPLNKNKENVDYKIISVKESNNEEIIKYAYSKSMKTGLITEHYINNGAKITKAQIDEAYTQIWKTEKEEIKQREIEKEQSNKENIEYQRLKEEKANKYKGLTSAQKSSKLTEERQSNMSKAKSVKNEKFLSKLLKVDGKIISRKNWLINSKLNGAITKTYQVRNHKKEEKLHEELYRSMQYLPLGNERHPDTIKFRKEQQKLEDGIYDNIMNLSMNNKSYPLTKTEFDFFNSL